jgi:outer membrane lipoprotein-sorting protein
MIDQDEKTYLEVPVFHLTNPQDFKASYLFSPLYFYNPVEAHYAMSLVYDVVESGEEDVEGLLCEKKELQAGNFLVQKAWISREYGIPVKLINYVQGETQMVFEVKDIEEVSLDASIFEIPEGYRPMKGE